MVLRIKNAQTCPNRQKYMQYCSMNKQCVEGLQKLKKSLLNERK